MLRSQLSILGMYQYDENIFAHLTIPSELDKETMIMEILSQCAELELIYPNFEVMQTLIKSWCNTELHIWERVYKDSTIEYNPIWNVDGTETETITREFTGNTSDQSNFQNKGNIKTDGERGVETDRTLDTVDTGSVKGYNDNGWKDSKKNVIDTDENVTVGETSSETVDSTNTGTESSSGTRGEKETITTEKVRGGNIGVTMTQQLLNADLDLLPRLNTYQYIVDSFKRRFCLLVY